MWALLMFVTMDVLTVTSLIEKYPSLAECEREKARIEREMDRVVVTPPDPSVKNYTFACRERRHRATEDEQR